MTSSPSPVVALDGAAFVPRLAAERFASSLATEVEVNALCQKHGVPSEFAARPAGERRACTPPPPGAVCVYAHALEAGLRFPLHAFFSETLSHFGLAPGQLTPNGWRVLVCFVSLCHSAGVPPSVPLFRHFFSLKKSGWFFFDSKKGAGALVTGLTSSKSESDWKRGFFFLKSTEPWRCPVRWGEPPSEISTTCPVLSSQDKKSVAKLVYTHGPGVDLQTYVSEIDLAAVFSSNFAGSSRAPPLKPSPHSPRFKGMDLTADNAVLPAEKMKADLIGDTPQVSGKKRTHDGVADAEDGLRRSEPNTALMSGCLAPSLIARKVLEGITTPSREGELAVAKTSDVLASTYIAILQAANYATFSSGYALELEKKQRAQEGAHAALLEQLHEVKTELIAVKQAGELELARARNELEAARRATESEVERAKMVAVQEFLASDEYTRPVAEQALPAYERGAEDMKHVALRLNPFLDANKLVLINDLEPQDGASELAGH